METIELYEETEYDGHGVSLGDCVSFGCEEPSEIIASTTIGVNFQVQLQNRKIYNFVYDEQTGDNVCGKWYLSGFNWD